MHAKRGGPPQPSARARAAIKDYRQQTSNPATKLKGYSCNTCGALGEHTEEHCPSKRLVGIPEARRRDMQEDALVHVTGTADATMPPYYITPHTLVPILRARLDVPSSLRCYACTLLANDAVWCGECDTVFCSTCLAPPDEAWVCSRCRNAKEYRFHVVTALREVASTWLEAMALKLDQEICLGNGGDGAASAPATAKRPRQ
jgi:hypothetical protein